MKTIGKRLRRGLKAVAEWCEKHRHEPVAAAAETPQRQAPRPLPVLRATDQLPESPAVLSERPSHLEGVARVAARAGDGSAWERYDKILRHHPLLLPRIMHSWAGARSHA